MRARYYEVSSGRFISEDPIRSGANWLAYANNDPISNSDYDGKSYTSAVILFLLGMLAIIVPFVITDANTMGWAIFGSVICLGSLLDTLDSAWNERQLQRMMALKNAQSDEYLEQLIGNELKALNSPETEAAEDSAAGPAIEGLIMDTGMLYGELAADWADNDDDNGESDQSCAVADSEGAA